MRTWAWMIEAPASTAAWLLSTCSETVIGTAGDGAGIYNQAPGGQLTVLNSTLSGNMATGASGNGGGVFNVDGPVALIHTTVAANSAGEWSALRPLLPQ